MCECNYLSDVNLISFLDFVKNNNLNEISGITSIYPQILSILTFLDVVTILGSDIEKKVSLTPLGESILDNFQLKNSLNNQDNVLHTISSDIQRIKSSLSAISLDIIRSQGTAQSLNSGSDLLLQPDNNIKDIPQRAGGSKIVPKSLSNQSIEDFKTFVQEKIGTSGPEFVNTFQKNLQQIKNNFSKVNTLLHTKNYNEFGFESFILLDSILIFVLKFFEQHNPAVLTLSLEEKSKILKDLPLKIDTQLLQFLDKINKDIQTNASDKLKVGEKTATKMFALIHTLYESFITIFQI